MQESNTVLNDILFNDVEVLKKAKYSTSNSNSDCDCGDCDCDCTDCACVNCDLGD